LLKRIGVSHPVILFDGFCNLCSKTVQTIIRWDKKKQFRFGALQSASGAKAVGMLKARFGKVPDTVVLVYNDKIYVKSEAMLRIAYLLGGVWYTAMLMWVLPRPIRDAAYDTVARRRYRWFGKRNDCLVPTPELKERFDLEEEEPAGVMKSTFA
jgi:predicted DCC family thiol-disulfide oxidoreductase YuxK